MMGRMIRSPRAVRTARRCAPWLAAIALVGCQGSEDRAEALGFSECGGAGCAPGFEAGSDGPGEAAVAASCPTWNTAVTVNPGDDLGVLTPEQFWAHRSAFVHAYANLALYPSPYLITGPAQSGIYGSIDWSVGWLFVDPYYIDNPYLLSITDIPGQVGSAESRCSISVDYGPDCTATVTVPAKDAQKWFELFYDNTIAEPGRAQLTLVNALDAGFSYASIDLAASENVDATFNAGPSSIVGGVCPITRYFYHHGKSGLNNLSPYDPATVFALGQRDVKTRIAIKLWRAEPKSAGAPSDATFVVRID